MENGRVTVSRSRIAVVTPLYAPSLGGVQETLRLFCAFLAENGHEVRVYTSQLRRMDEIRMGQFKTVKNFPAEEVKDGVRIKRCPAGGLLEAALGFLAAVSRKLRLPISGVIGRMHRARGMRKAAILWELDSFNPDVILVAPATDPVLSIGLEASRRKPVIKLLAMTALHISDLEVRELSRLVRQLCLTDIAIVNTDYEKEFLVSHGLGRDKVIVAGPGVDTGRFLSLSGGQADKRAVDAVSNKPYVLYCGRQQDGKGIDCLIDAVEILRPDYPELAVALAGEKTAYSEEASVEWKSKPFFLDIGYVDEVTKRWLMENAVAFSMVSRADSYGIVYCEAWLARRPVIGADNAQMRCVIRDGEDGFLVPYSDASALAAKIRYFLERPDEARRMGERGHEKVMNQFGARMQEQKLYNLLLQNG